MRVLLRIVGLAALAAFAVMRVWLGVLALAQLIGLPWAIVLALALLLSGFTLPLRIAVFFGALALWHWPMLPALILAAPRLILMLPGLISTLLASRRHPRPRWSRFKSA
ncbi:MAG TPA: hypothetical protein VHN17_09260 [Steroidobacteraceae bacterium]|jgi:hypothetical protein|nr:hypothetical protein [Steroidobacteraceae bacterium]